MRTIPTSEAYKELNLPSSKALLSYLSEFKPGIHYQDRRKRSARKGKYYCNVEEVRAHWNKPPERR